MGSLVALLGMMCFLALWLFLRFKPATTNARALRVVNQLVLGLAGVLAVSWILRVYATYDSSGTDGIQVAQFAAFGSLGLSTLVVSIGFLVRNFLIFKPDRFYR